MADPLAWLGARIPNTRNMSRLTPEQKKRADDERQRKVMEDRTKHPIKAGISDTLDMAGEFLSGITGIGKGQDTQFGQYGELVDAASDLIPGKAAAGKALSLAGMPWAWYKAQDKIPKHGIIHSTSTPWSKFDPEKLEEGAFGKGLYGFKDPDIAKKFWERDLEEGVEPSGMQMPFEPVGAQNVLDLIDVDPQDFHKIFKQLPPERQSMIEELVNTLVGQGMTNYQAYAQAAKHLNAPTGSLERAGFDAVRYPYGGAEAWMAPSSTAMKTPSGVAINPAAEPLKPIPPERRAVRESFGPQIPVTPTPTQVGATRVPPTPPRGSKPKVKVETSAPSTPVTLPTILSTGQQKPRLVKPEKKMSVAELMAAPSNLTPEQEAAKKKLMEDIKRRMNK